MAAVEQPAVPTNKELQDRKLTNGVDDHSHQSAHQLKLKMSGGGPGLQGETPPNGSGSGHEANGGGGGYPGQYPGYYPGYAQPPYPPGPPKPGSGAGYPPYTASQSPGPPTPTLNSLLQDRGQRFPAGYEGPGGPPAGPPGAPGGPPGGHPGYPGWGYQGHPNYRGQSESERFGMDSEYSEVPVQSQEAGNVSPQRGTGRKRGRPKGSGTGRGRASKGASPSQSPKPGPPRPPSGYGGYYGGYPPPPHGGGYPPGPARAGAPGYPPPGPPQGYPGPRPPPSNGPPPPTSAPSNGPSYSGPGEYPPPPHKAGEGGEGPHPPPPPSKHEGPPASTWTPPVHSRQHPHAKAPGGPGSGPPSEAEIGGPQSGSEDGRPESAEPAVRQSASPRPRPSPSPRPRPSPSPTGSSSSRSMSPAIGQSREGSVSMPPRPASGASEGNGPTAMNSSPGPGYGPGPGQPNMGPPPHMYKGHGPPPGPPGQGAPPYHGYPGGYQGQRPGPGYGGPGYGPYGPHGPRPGGQYPGYPPQGQYPGPGPQGWNGPSAPPGKGGPPPPGQPGGPQMRMGAPGGPPGYGGPGRPYPGPPSSYNGPSYNGPGPGGYPPGHPGPGYPGYPGPASTTANSVPPSNPSSDQTSDNSEAKKAAPVTSVETTGPDGQPMLDETSQQSTLSQSSDNSGGRQTPKGGYPQGYPHGPGTPHSAPSPGSMGSSQDDAPLGSPHGWGRLPPASPVGTPGPQAKVENLQRLYEIDDNPDRKSWLDKLLNFMEERGTPITQCPTISKNPLDLYKLYIYTKDRGGFLECTNKKAWKDIAAQLGIGPSSSGAYTLKKHYGKNLLPFECHFERGGIDPAPILSQVEAQSKKKGKNAGSNARPPSPGSQDSRDSFTGNSADGFSGYPPPPPHPTHNNYNNYPPPPGAPGAPPPGGPGGPPPSGPPSGPPPPHPHHPGVGVSQSNDLSYGYEDYSNNYRQQHQYRGQGPGMSGAPGQGYPPSYPPAQRPGGGPHEGYGGQPGYNNYPGHGGPPPGWNAHPPTSGNDVYNRGYPGYPPRPGPYPGPAPQGGPPPPTSSSSGTPPPPAQAPVSQPYDQYQKSSVGPGNGPTPSSGGPSGPPAPPGPGPQGPPGPPGSPMQSPGPRPMMIRPQSHQGGPGPGSHPVILRANSPATPGTIQDTLPPALPVQRIPNPHGYQAAGGPPGGPMPPPSSAGGYYPGGPPSSKPSGPPNASIPPNGPPMPSRGGPGYPGHYGGPPRPMFPQGSPSWGGRPQYSGPPYGGSPGGPPPGARPGGPGPGGSAWPSDRPPYGPQYTAGQSGPTWASPQRPSVRPQYSRPELRPAPRPMPPGRREAYNFPVDSLEQTQPLLMRRKKLTKVDVQPVEGWRLVMALKSGLLMESTWALDTLNILLFDDNSVAYFGLGNMPGLLDALIDHWRASLIAVFDVARDLEMSTPKTELQRKRKREKVEKSLQGLKWYEKKPTIVEDEAGLGIPDSEALRRGEKVRILHHQPRDFTVEARFSEKEYQVDEQEDKLFVIDDEREWDTLTDHIHPGQELFAYGVGLDTTHIISADDERPHLPFVRILKDDPRSNSTDSPKKTLKECGDGSKTDSAVSPSKKHGKRVREAWRVLPAKSEPEKAEKEKGGEKGSNGSNVNGDSNNKNSQPAPAMIKSEQTESAVTVKSEPNNVTSEKESQEKQEKDPLEILREKTGIVVQPGLGFETRWNETVLEEENYQPDCASLNLVSDWQDNLGKRAAVVSTIFRNLSFIPGNETALSSCPAFLAICGKMLLHFHWHPVRTSKQRNYDRGDEEDFSDSCTSLTEQREWWWEHLQVIRENIMVAIANIAGHTELAHQPENLVRPLLAGLLEWAVSPAAAAQDSFPNVGPHSPISPQRLAIESLCKLCVQEHNVDLLLSTPPFTRIEKLCGFLSKKLYRSEDQVLREFAINLLFYFSQADSGVARTIALQDNTVSLLIGFIEQAESNALIVAQQHGVNALRDNPDSMGTSLDMLRRAANTLNYLARHEDNKTLFVKHEGRLLNLVMSQILDQGVASIISQVLFQVTSS